MIAFDIRHYDAIGSTSDEAMRLAAQGAPHGTVVHADQQTTGRGRLSRRWFSPPGNLYLSIILRLEHSRIAQREVGFVAALAVADAIDAMLPPRVRATLKWPNDVLVNDGKISGILLEQADSALVLGIGVNVLQEPSHVTYKVSTLVGCGGLAAVDDTRARLLAALANWLMSGSETASPTCALPGWRARIRRARRSGSVTVIARLSAGLPISLMMAL